MSGYIGNTPIPQATQTRDSFTATASQTSFATGGYTPNFLDVFLNGLKLNSSQFTATNGTDVVLTSAASSGDIVEVIAYTAFEVADASFDDLALGGDLTVGGTVDGVDVASIATTANSAMQDLVDDTTPQLGGDLNAETNDITNVGNIDVNTIDLSSQLDAVVTSPAQNTPILALNKFSASSAGTGRFITFSSRSTSGGGTTLRGMIGISNTSSPQVSNPFMSHASGSNGIVCSYSGSSSFNAITPCSSTGSASNGSLHLGHAYAKWNTVYAATGSINTSDITKKQDIEELSEAESKVAIAAKGLLRKYRWKESVVEKGDNARIHFGIMAQDLKAAFEAEGLDANKYGMFCADTRWTTDGTDTYATEEEAPEAVTEETVYGVRYEELLAFIIAAI